MAVLILFLLSPFLIFLLIILLLARRRPSVPTIGFFHPYADAGGGGERVLWHSVSALLNKWTTLHCTIIHGEKSHRTPDRILHKVKLRFGLDLPQERIKFVYLRCRFLVEATTWPRFTLIGQCIGSVLLGLEAIFKSRQHVYVDTMGYAFTYPLYRWLAGVPVVAYVHYPIVSADMLRAVESRQASFNNSTGISHSKVLTRVKVYYYRLLALLYGFVGRRSNVTMVNSTWTYNHMTQLWRRDGLHIVYPPCDVKTFSNIAHNEDKEHFRIVSIGQFRPEKNHTQQLDIMQSILTRFPERNPLLIIIGSCRDEGDHARVEELRHSAVNMNILPSVQFLVNVSFEQLLRELELATVAIHTMKNEHFGISLVECMSAGCVMMAHRSGGPQMDIIIDNKTGFLANSTEEFVDNMNHLMSLTEEERSAIAKEGQENVMERFSVEAFEENILKHLGPIIQKYI